MSSVKIETDGIERIPADAIVNAANEGLWHGGGVCGSIFAQAGCEELTRACKEIGHCDTGKAVITPAFGCQAKFIIHAVGPVWIGGSNGEAELLYGAYASSLELCKENDIHSVVFPLISAGLFGYPIKEAWQQAARACKSFVEKNRSYKIDIIFAIPKPQIAEVGKDVLLEEGLITALAKINSENEKIAAFKHSFEVTNLKIAAPTIRKYSDLYCIESLEYYYDGKNPPRGIAFWHEDGKNGIFSQRHKTSFNFNGRKYVSVDQYVMSEKALLFEDFDLYRKILNEPDPEKCTALGNEVRNFDQEKWDKNFLDIVFTGNCLKAQNDIKFLDALLLSGNTVLIYANPDDDFYGAGVEEKNLLDENGLLKLAPSEWHRSGCTSQAKNYLGFVLMGLRNFYKEFFGGNFY